METAVSFALGFVFGGLSGALYTTNLYGYKPADLVEAQKRRNEEWGKSINEALGFKDKDQHEQQIPAQPVQQQATEPVPVIVESVNS